ncbi:carbonic anhydrase family protein [Synechococcus moorigangaii CMS01]|nr:carbonic anhydrase family protein [Synechococcus moorigangaii CMS01]
MGKKALAIACILLLCGLGLFGLWGDDLKHAEQASPRWDYGDRGPSQWAQLDSSYSQCGVSKGQSPRDLKPTPTDPKVVHGDYRPTFGIVQDKGTTLQVRVGAGNSLSLGKTIYPLRQIHFHHPSEHLFEGKRFPMEIHFVHQDETGAIAVLGVMIKAGATNASFAHLLQRWPRENQNQGTVIDLDLPQLLPKGSLPNGLFQDSPHFRYTGSLTTPPCSGGVQWLVLQEPLSLGIEQIMAYRTHYRPNARPVQP